MASFNPDPLRGSDRASSGSQPLFRTSADADALFAFMPEDPVTRPDPLISAPAEDPLAARLSQLTGRLGQVREASVFQRTGQAMLGQSARNVVVTGAVLLTLVVAGGLFLFNRTSAADGVGPVRGMTNPAVADLAAGTSTAGPAAPGVSAKRQAAAPTGKSTLGQRSAATVAAAGPRRTNGRNATQSLTTDSPASFSVALDAPVPTTGSLSINARPWADVWIDGHPAGTTPLANIKVPVGSHQVLWRHPQLGERRQAVQVTADSPARVGMDFRDK